MGGWELFCVGRGENTDGMSTDNPGDKPECWTFGKLGPAPNGDTLPEASSPPCMAVTKGLPQREHSMGPGKETPCPAQVLCVWLFCLLVPSFQQST